MVLGRNASDKHASSSRGRAGARKSMRPARILALGLCVVALVVVLSGCGGNSAARSSSTSLSPSKASTTTAAASSADVRTTLVSSSSAVPFTDAVSPAESVAADIGPSVVNVRVTGVTSNGFFGNEPYEGVGSGVIYSSDGYIITCDHVVNENGTPAQTVEVTFSDGEKVPAKIVGSDSFTDIAVIKVNMTGLRAASFAQAALVKAGEYAIAIGSPEDYSNSVTMGIVSGLGRSVENAGSTALVDLIQTDAAISPGNSGGALLNSAGDVIGINEAYLPPASTGAENVAFAIPADTAVSIAKELIATGHATHPYMGIDDMTVTSEVQQQYGLSLSSGVLVTNMDSTGPAAKAGLEQGDIIVGFAGTPITQEADLILALRAAKVGSTVPVKIDRNGKALTLKLTLVEAPSSGAASL